MKVLLVAATPFEMAPTDHFLTEHFDKNKAGIFQKNELEVESLITGVGMPLTGFALGRAFAREQYDLAINAGVAGAIRPDLEIGSVVHVVSERWGDLGVEEADGSFTDIHEMGLISPDEPPFSEGVLHNASVEGFDFLPKVRGLTVNKVHGSAASIEAMRRKYEVDVETMEGAAFFLACLLSETPFLEIRSISNRVEPRNREGWNLPLAIDRLNETLMGILNLLAG
ncbi:MAG: futalosine hydrolase [Bacteroidetes bacterium]|nr:MAG: futalosine hydrolase [Bacteroidota bacterium]